MRITLTNTKSQVIDIYSIKENEVEIGSGIQRMVKGNAIKDVVAIKKVFTVNAMVEGDIDLSDFRTDTLVLQIDDKKYNVLVGKTISKNRVDTDVYDVSFTLEEV